MGTGNATDRFKSADAASYDPVVASFDKFTDRYSTPLAEAVVGFLGPKPAAAVLDIGCGTGVLSLAAARLRPEARVLGIDLSDGMLHRAAERTAELGLAGRVEYRSMDAEALDLGDGTFDAVVSLFALMHFPNPRVALAEMFRVLRPGGTLVLAVGSGPSLFSRVGVVRGVRRVVNTVRRWQGLYLSAPGCLEGMARKYLPPTEVREESALAGHGVGRPAVVGRLVSEVGFRVTDRRWVGGEADISDPDEFWELQTTYSSLVRKRLAAAPPEAVAGLRREFFERCRRVLDRGGRLAYPRGAYVVVAGRP